MMRQKKRKKSGREPDSVLSETKSWRGKLCYFSEEQSGGARTRASGTTSLHPA